MELGSRRRMVCLCGCLWRRGEGVDGVPELTERGVEAGGGVNEGGGAAVGTGGDEGGDVEGGGMGCTC